MKKGTIIIFMLLMMRSAFAQIPTVGLIAYYPFCGNAKDASGNGNHGVVNGALLTTDRFGNPNSAYSFNGVNNYINLPPADFGNLDVFSCSLWMRPTSNANAGNIAFCVGSSTDPYCWGINYNPPNVFAGCYNNGSNPVQSYVNSPAIPAINTWIHVLVKRDFSNLTLYVNGTMVQQLPGGGTNNQSVDYGTPPYRAVIGARSTLSNFFPGQIDDIRMYNLLLTQNDIASLYNEAPFTVSVNSGTICSGNSFTMVPSGGTSYTFSSGSAVVSPTSNSNYFVTASNAPGCISTAILTVAVSLCTGIEPLKQYAPDFIVFPNPGNHNISVQLKGIEGKNAGLILCDLQGRIVKSISLDPGTNNFEIHTDLSPGSYFARLVVDNSIVAEKKLLILNQ